MVYGIKYHSKVIPSLEFRNSDFTWDEETLWGVSDVLHSLESTSQLSSLDKSILSLVTKDKGYGLEANYSLEGIIGDVLEGIWNAIKKLWNWIFGKKDENTEKMEWRRLEIEIAKKATTLPDHYYGEFKEHEIEKITKPLVHKKIITVFNPNSTLHHVVIKATELAKVAYEIKYVIDRKLTNDELLITHNRLIGNGLLKGNGSSFLDAVKHVGSTDEASDGKFKIYLFGKKTIELSITPFNKDKVDDGYNVSYHITADDFEDYEVPDGVNKVGIGKELFELYERNYNTVYNGYYKLNKDIGKEIEEYIEKNKGTNDPTVSKRLNSLLVLNKLSEDIYENVIEVYRHIFKIIKENIKKIDLNKIENDEHVSKLRSSRALIKELESSDSLSDLKKFINKYNSDNRGDD